MPLDDYYLVKGETKIIKKTREVISKTRSQDYASETFIENILDFFGIKLNEKKLITSQIRCIDLKVTEANY